MPQPTVKITETQYVLESVGYILWKILWLTNCIHKGSEDFDYIAKLISNISVKYKLRLNDKTKNNH